MEPRAAQPERYDRLPVEMGDRQCFQHARSSIGYGSAGHWIRMAGILSPLIIGELVKDADQRWRLIRIASLTTALVSEGLHAQRISQERREREQKRERCA
jgi:hypothetical protein